jgi:hypothetical protein
MASVTPWKVPVRASWFRATVLSALHVGGGGLTLKLVEEDAERTWELSFGTVQAFRVTTEECAASILERLPEQGGFFEVQDSAWLKELGQGTVQFLQKARHFIVCCYDEIVEIVGTDPNFVSIERDDSETALHGRQQVAR